jgi:orotate phosphoribosyltransferase
MVTKQGLIEDLRELGCIRYQPDNPFTLASGKVSPWYFDIKRACCSSLLEVPIVELLMDELPYDYCKCIGGVANAGYFLVGGICSQYCVSEFTGFVLRKQPKDHGIEGAIDGIPPKEGSHVTLVEDVITTGGSLVKAIKYVEEVVVGTVDRILTVVDRNEGDHPEFAPYRSIVKSIITREEIQQEAIKWR